MLEEAVGVLWGDAADDLDQCERGERGQRPERGGVATAAPEPDAGAGERQEENEVQVLEGLNQLVHAAPFVAAAAEPVGM
jgi:hypothetical protein